jgi:hypothetical protein
MGEGEPEEEIDVTRKRNKVNYILFMSGITLLKEVELPKIRCTVLLGGLKRIEIFLDVCTKYFISPDCRLRMR